jgi:hypothetical protein
MDLVEQKPVVPPLQRHLQLETDFFCHQCGYNLHGQIVTRDERLDIMICRCPECGRFHPAAFGVSATRPWLARLGVSIIISWTLTAIAIFLASGFFTGLFSYIHLDYYSTRNYPQSAYVSYRDVPRIVKPTPSPASYEYERFDTPWKVLGSLSIANAVLLGSFCAISMWHVRKERLYFALAWPILAALVTYGLWWANENIDLIVSWSIVRLTLYTVINITAMAVGLKVGRPIARFLLRVLVSPKLRQHVHFLWVCDGLQPPGISGVTGVSA